MSNPYIPYSASPAPPYTPSSSQPPYGYSAGTPKATNSKDEPTTRSRTLFYLSVRDSSTFASTSRHRVSRAQREYGHNVALEDGEEEEGLIDGNQGGRSGWTEVGIKGLPPKWVDASERVEEILNRTRLKIATLDKLHAKHVLPGFTDRSAEEREIERQTSDITRSFRECTSLIGAITPERGAPRVQSFTAKNVQRGLAQKVQDMSGVFRKKQKVYMQKLQGHAIKNKDLMVASGALTLKGTDVLDELAADEQATYQSQSQLQGNPELDREIRQRSAEIDQIASSISELADLFRDISNLVVEQGTILDSVEYNVLLAAREVESGEKELVVAKQYQDRSGRRKCIFFVVLCILALISIILFLPGRDTSSSSPAPAYSDGMTFPSATASPGTSRISNGDGIDIVLPSAVATASKTGGRYLPKPPPLPTAWRRSRERRNQLSHIN